MSDFKSFKKYQEAIQNRDWQTCDLIADENEALLKQVKKLQTENERLRALAEMVEDHRKMPHQHIEAQDKLYCLTERAREILEELKEGRDESNKEQGVHK